MLYYSQEQLIQNRSIVLSKEKPDAARFYIDYCQKNEYDYNNLRRAMPTYLEEASAAIESLESAGLCDTVYVYQAEKKDLCKTTFDSLLQEA